MDELRMKKGRYETEARLKGFSLQLKPLGQKGGHPGLHPGMEQGPAPGFDGE